MKFKTTNNKIIDNLTFFEINKKIFNFIKNPGSGGTPAKFKINNNIAIFCKKFLLFSLDKSLKDSIDSDKYK